MYRYYRFQQSFINKQVFLFLHKRIKRAVWRACYIQLRDVGMESTGKYWISVFNILKQHRVPVTLSCPKYTKQMKGNKINCKDAKWICDLYKCSMFNPSFISSADIRELRILVRYWHKLPCMVTREKERTQKCLTVSNLKSEDVFSDIFGKSVRCITE